MTRGPSAPPPVRALALGILVRVERDRAHAAPLLDRRAAPLAPRERDLLRALVKTTLRHAIRLDHVLGRHLARPLPTLDPPVRAALRLGAAQLLAMDRVPAHAALAETVEAAKVLAPRASGLVNAVLRRVAAKEKRPGAVILPEGADAAARLALETAHPEWLVRRWLRLFGTDRARAALEADNADSPIDLLLDPRAGSEEALRRRLAEGGVEIVASPIAPLAWTVVSGEAAAHELVASQALAVVDAAAQAVAALIPPAETVVDLAAAPGGKTRTLLARGLAQRVVALERHPTRARRLASNLAGAGRRREVLVALADGERPPLRKGAFSAVLLDAPCSGTGTLRKNPEIRLRLEERDLAGFAAVQRRLLKAGLALLAPGGALVYVTCSLEKEENDDVIAAILAETPGYAPDPIRDSELPAGLASALAADGFVRIPPGATNDGFTARRIRRESRDS